MTLRVSYSIFLTGIKLYLNFCLFLLLGNKKNRELCLAAPLGTAPSFNYFF